MDLLLAVLDAAFGAAGTREFSLRGQPDSTWETLKECGGLLRAVIRLGKAGPHLQTIGQRCLDLLCDVQHAGAVSAAGKTFTVCCEWRCKEEREECCQDWVDLAKQRWEER